MVNQSPNEPLLRLSYDNLTPHRTFQFLSATIKDQVTVAGPHNPVQKGGVRCSFKWLHLPRPSRHLIFASVLALASTRLALVRCRLRMPSDMRVAEALRNEMLCRRGLRRKLGTQTRALQEVRGCEKTHTRSVWEFDASSRYSTKPGPCPSFHSLLKLNGTHDIV